MEIKLPINIDDILIEMEFQCRSNPDREYRIRIHRIYTCVNQYQSGEFYRQFSCCTSAEQIMAILEKSIQIDFFRKGSVKSYIPPILLHEGKVEELNNESPGDFPDCTITIMIHSHKKKVKLYFGMPQGYIELRELIEEICIEPLMKRVFEQKPTICPVCQSSKIADLLFCARVFNKELDQKLASGKYVLGGFFRQQLEDPDWCCVDCNTSYFKANVPNRP